jgi:ribosomal-protein-alanine N-acetyltransferase
MMIKAKNIRWLVRRDLTDIINIEQLSYEVAWTKQDFERQLQHKNCIGLVATLKEDIVGYVIYMLHKERIEVINMAVHPKYQKQGIGTTILEKIKNKLGNKRNRMTVDIEEYNLIAQLFLKSNGFLATRTNKYSDSADSYEMEFFEHIT